jgi:predicted MFS family arabinose efflux permease
VRFRLSLLMFLQYAFPGALLQLYSLHLQNLGFGPLEVGACCSTQAVASVLVTLLVGQAADRWFSAERCLAVCALLAGVLLWVLPELRDVRALFAVTLLFWMLTNPILLLGTALSFAHLPHPERDYGPVRLWGTVGWMVPCWLLLAGGLFGGLFWQGDWDACTWLFRLGAAFAIVLGVYALTLPHTPPRRDAPRRAAPLAALRLVRGRSFAVYCVCLVGVCVTWPFTTQATPLLLARLGLPRIWISPTMTISQVTEIIALALLPMLLLRLGIRGTMLLGLGAWTAALTLLALGQPLLVLSSLVFNGFCVSGFLVAGQVLVNRHATGDLRASVQALLSFVNGSAQLAGHFLVGWLRSMHGGQTPQAFTVAACIMAGMCVLFVAAFRDDGRQPAAGKRMDAIDKKQL